MPLVIAVHFALRMEFTRRGGHFAFSRATPLYDLHGPAL
jgi:hypothetical protein